VNSERAAFAVSWRVTEL